jgi:predicted AlkP superfamily pyrophosphatase or phosphodiesterase
MRERARRSAAAAAGIFAALLLLVGAASAQPPAGSGGTNRPEHLDKPYLVLVSLDGFKAEYLDRLKLPNLQRAMQRGTRAKAMVPVFPSLTFPNHYSLVTGLHPGNHGIVNNRFYDPARKAVYSIGSESETVADASWYRGEPIWVTAEKQGMVSACFFWPGSEAPIQGIRPTIWNRYDGSIDNTARVGTVLEWLALPPERRPHVVTLYFSELDTASHERPLEDPEVAAAAESLDRSIGQLLDGLDALPHGNRVYVLITSDHGMVNTSSSQTVPLESLLDAQELADIETALSGPVASLHVRGGVARARQLRDRINTKLARGMAYLRAELPERYYYRDDPRAGDIVVVMDEAWVLLAPRRAPAAPAATATQAVAERPRAERRGAHGWDNVLPSMRAVFLIVGPGIRQGALVPEVNNVDVYPLMTDLLGLEPAAGIDGTPGAIGSLVKK